MKNLFLCIAFTFTFCVYVNAQDAMQAAFAKSYSYEKGELYAQAIDELRKVYQAGHYEVNLRLGYLYYLAGQYQESIGYYTKAMELQPKCIQAKLGMTLPQAAIKKWETVMNLYEEILAIAPSSSYVSYKLGLLHYDRKNYVQAYKCFELVYTLYPFDYEGLLMMGWVNVKLGKKAEAKEFFNKTLLISPHDKSALEGLSLLK
jgi:tetratricopeptide (TPR) repeat protein